MSTSIIAALLCTSCSTQPEFALLITGGSVIDGTGTPSQRIDIGIQGDRIVALGDLTGRRAATTLDASGRVVAPGFIDVVSRSGLSLLANPSADSHLRQGITSEILAGDVAFWTDATTDAEGLRRAGITRDWHDLTTYFAALGKRGTTVNVGTLVPMSAARRATAGAVSLVDSAMADGAFGVVDDIDASQADMAAVAAIVGRREGVLLLPAQGAAANDDDRFFALGALAHRIVVENLAGAPPAQRSGLLDRIRRANERQIAAAGTLVPVSGSEQADDVNGLLKYGSMVIGTDTTFGAFPRLLGQLARDAHAIDQREAIRRSTSLAAGLVGISERGIIREHYFADLVVFDPATIADRATLEQPQQPPAGIDYVIVNGVVALTARGPTGARPGYGLLHRAPGR
jgi:N-acyl-D-aspartate/D-glutamate deacylase